MTSFKLKKKSVKFLGFFWSSLPNANFKVWKPKKKKMTEQYLKRQVCLNVFSILYENILSFHQ